MSQSTDVELRPGAIYLLKSGLIMRYSNETKDAHAGANFIGVHPRSITNQFASPDDVVREITRQDLNMLLARRSKALWLGHSYRAQDVVHILNELFPN